MGCTHCHDPHAARPKIRNRVLRFETCVKCHKRYRGPFVFEHQADRREYCVTCHLPHGSPNNRMLKQHTSQQNCLQCHGDFPSFHDQSQGAVFTNCLQCHTQVHGSNHSRYLLR
jgi:predicted CXXCH cytochrome family protein